MSYESCLSILGDEMAKEALTSEEVLSQLRKHKPELEEKFGLTSMALYGVYAPDDTSQFFDIDLMVTFDGSAAAKRFLGRNTILRTCWDYG